MRHAAGRGPPDARTIQTCCSLPFAIEQLRRLQGRDGGQGAWRRRQLSCARLQIAESERLATQKDTASAPHNDVVFAVTQALA